MQGKSITAVSRRKSSPVSNPDMKNTGAIASRITIDYAGLRAFNRIAFVAGCILLIAAAVQALLFNSLLSGIDAKLKEQTAVMRETNQHLFQSLGPLVVPLGDVSTANKNPQQASIFSQKEQASQLQISSTGIRTVQEALKQKGFYQGDTNGRFDENTKSALQQFQITNKLPPEGSLDKMTLERLGIKGDFLEQIR